MSLYLLSLSIYLSIRRCLFVCIYLLYLLLFLSLYMYVFVLYYYYLSSPFYVCREGPGHDATQRKGKRNVKRGKGLFFGGKETNI